MSSAPREARSFLEGSDDAALLSRSPEDLVRHLVRMLEVPPLEYDDEGSGYQEGAGGTVTIKLHLPTAVEPHVSQYLGLLPTHSRQIPQAAIFDGRYIVVTGLPAANAAVVLESLKMNMDALNRDITAGAATLEAHITTVVTSYLNGLREARDKHARELSELRAKVRQLPAEPPLAERHQEPTAHESARPEAVVDAASQDWEGALADAVKLVSGTTSAAVQLRAIDSVRDITVRWADYNAERRLFAGQILLGLDALAEFVREEAPPEQRKTVLENLRSNIEQAIAWANGNDYVKFAGQLMLLKEFVEAF